MNYLDHRSGVQPTVPEQIFSRFLPLGLWHLAAGEQFIFQARRLAFLNFERLVGQVRNKHRLNEFQ